MPFPAPFPGDFSHAQVQQEQEKAKLLEEQQQQQKMLPTKRGWGEPPDYKAPPGPNNGSYGTGVMPAITN